MRLFQRALVAALLFCCGCAAQSNTPPDVAKRVERRVRATYQLPADVDISIVNRKPDADFANFDDLTVQLSQGDKKQNEAFLISKDDKTLVRMTRMDLTKDPYVEIMNKIDVAGRPVLGDNNAKVTIVSYDDFECPFCARIHQTLMQDIMKNYAGRVRLIYKDFPIDEIHPWATHAAINANCLAAQNNDAYWDFANVVHGNQQTITGNNRALPEQFSILDKVTTDVATKHKLNIDTLQACMKAQDMKAIKASQDEGDKLGVNATPALFINGVRVDGAVSADTLHQIIDRALRDASQNGTTTTAAAVAKK